MGRKPILDLIVDVETITIFTPLQLCLCSDAIFNVGVVAGVKGKVIHEENACIREFWHYPEHRIVDYYRKNFTEDDFTSHYADMDCFLEEYFYPLYDEYCKTYDVRLWSYNAFFDKGAFEHTQDLMNLKVRKDILDKWNCIMVLSNTVLKDNVKYINWLVDMEYQYQNNQFITAGGNASTKAETVYRFITQDPTFIEQHKGMQDAQIELEILESCKKKGYSKIDRKPRGGGWQILNYLAQPFQKKGHIHLYDNLTLESTRKLQELVAKGNIGGL